MPKPDSFRAELESLFISTLTSGLSEEDKLLIEGIRLGKDNIELPEELLSESEQLEERRAIFLVSQMRFPEKVKLALSGNKNARFALLRDSNRQIPLFVLENPQITEGEVQELASNSNVDDAVLRAIASDSSWMKPYQTKLNLVSNPKTPIDVSIKWLKYLKDRDLMRLSKSKNIPQVVSTQCSKLKEERAQKV